MTLQKTLWFSLLFPKNLTTKGAETSIEKIILHTSSFTMSWPKKLDLQKVSKPYKGRQSNLSGDKTHAFSEPSLHIHPLKM